MRKSWILISLSCVIIYGCSPQQSQKKFASLQQSGSYKQNNKYVVEFRGGGVTTYQKAKEYAMMRAAQATLAHGFRYFKVVKKDNISEVKKVKNIAQDSVEQFALFSSVSKGADVIERSPGVRIYFECFQEDPKIFSIIDAEEYLKTISK